MKHKDNFADIRNGRLTLPYYLLKQAGYDLHSLRDEILSSTAPQDRLIEIYRKEEIAHRVIDVIRNDVHVNIEHLFAELANTCKPKALANLRSIAAMSYYSNVVRTINGVS